MASLSAADVLRHVAHLSSRRALEFGLMDIAQDLVLRQLHSQGISESVIFKGGTALRKFYAGNAGRFSTDLDFAVSKIEAPPTRVTQIICEAIDGFEECGFAFRVQDRRGRKQISFQSAAFPNIEPLLIKLDIAACPWLPGTEESWVPLPVHTNYGEPVLPYFPIIRMEENIAEKIARLNRGTHARDLVDLAWIATSRLLAKLDVELIRSLAVLKIWVDAHGVRTHDDTQWRSAFGNEPFQPHTWLRDRVESEVDLEDVGALGRQVPDLAWLNGTIRNHYGFLARMNREETVIAHCNASDRDLVLRLLATLPGQLMRGVF